MFMVTSISSAIFLAALVNVVVFAASWRIKKSKSGLYFALGALGLAVWALASALDYAAIPLDLKIFFAKIEAAGYHSALAFFALFGIAYAGNDHWLEGKWSRVVFFSLPIGNILLTLTNEWHGWIWSGFERRGNNVVVFEHGPAFTWVVFTGYFFIGAAFVNLWIASRKGSDIARNQTRWLMFALLFPLAINALYLFAAGGAEGVDWTSVTFAVSGVLILRALYGARLLDIVPIARDHLFNSLSDGMIALDLESRVIDINQAAIDAFGKDMIGKDLAEGTPFTHAFLDQPHDTEFRREIVAGDKIKRHYDALVSPLYDGKNNVIGRLLLLRDITDRKETEIHLLQLEEAIKQSPASVVITDRDGMITYVNPWFETLTGYSQREVIGKNPRIVQSGLTPPETYREMWQTILSGKPWRGELLNRKKNGELYWEFQVIAPVLDHGGNILNFIAVKEDITERKRAENALREANRQLEKNLVEIKVLQAELREQAIRDPLTQMYNRRFLNETIEHEFGNALRLSQPISLILLDIDYFKSINDRYGHIAGDAYLVMLANLLKENTRKSDIACRFGGEEFLLVLQGTGLEDAARYAEKLRELFARSALTFDGREVKATISLGVASCPMHGKEYGKVVRKADGALYISKQAGRNRVTVWAE